MLKCIQREDDERLKIFNTKHEFIASKILWNEIYVLYNVYVYKCVEKTKIKCHSFILVGKVKRLIVIIIIFWLQSI